ncbi:hypothetical protein DY124_07795 [Apilactobacillus micheneri]|uniref:hypothetical protein n=1 Tax=Apilactobacillus micheneri TaxID=1899430 RepID=UPI00112EE043|nr:hypothetical protein [Apilactobacillus micheneri]TPR42312.1 hypothetical protein DY124_07795 [Apilactobacillus micheneri]TPR47041.1 hypothetical protein DY125_07665 [Apilactobacillus micheneri]
MSEERIDNDTIKKLIRKRRRAESQTKFQKSSYQVKMKNRTKDRLDRIKKYMAIDKGKNVSRPEAIEQALDFYFTTVVSKNIKEGEALERFYSNYGSYNKISKIQENSQITMQLALTILQNIGLQGLDKSIPINSYIENLNEVNETSDLYNYMKELYGLEKHQNKMNRY